ncbi:hypothetical protein LSO10F_200018 [Candidatus Liberibacter solanacearum]
MLHNKSFHTLAIKFPQSKTVKRLLLYLYDNCIYIIRFIIVMRLR